MYRSLTIVVIYDSITIDTYFIFLLVGLYLTDPLILIP